MILISRPWHVLILALSAWISGEQERAMEYLQAENQDLREMPGKSRILLNDDQWDLATFPGRRTPHSV